MLAAVLSAGILGAVLTAIVMAGAIRALRKEVQACKVHEIELQAVRAQLESRALDLERHVSDVEEARTRIESQAVDYVGLMEELAIAQAETQRAHGDLKLKEEQLRRMTDSLPALVADVDANGCYRYCNLRYLDFYDMHEVDIVGQHASKVFGEEAFETLRPDQERVLEGQEVSFRRAVLSRGETRQLEGKYIPQIDATGVVVGFYVAAWDVTEQYRREVELNREVTTDALTGLLNRRAVLEALAELTRNITNGGASGAVLFLDIDHFKQINDTLGHAAGDQLLKIFAQRLRGAVRGSDRVARLGGDEFVVLLLDVGTPENAEKVARKILDRIAVPVGLEDQMIQVGTSIGVAHCTGEQVTAEFLLQEADAALYEAKKAGRGTYRLRKVKPSVELV
jgi:diguanylate cyclase (GGDEF)-like protein/PAS domain S-box-containing protein